MRIVYFGSGLFGVPTLASLWREGHEILAVVTQPDRPGGRGRQPTPTPIKRFALEHGLAVIQAADVNSPDVVQRIVGLGPELGVVVAFGQLLGRELLRRLGYRVVNLHASLLPKYRGAAPINWVIIRGETQTGLTVFRLAERMDAGEILGQCGVVILPEETAATLHDRLAELGPALMGSVVSKFADGADPRGQQQDDSQASPARKLSKSDGHLRFDQPAEVVARWICGLWSWPGARCRFVSADGRRAEQVTLARARVVDLSGGCSAEAGTVGDDLSIVCRPGRVELLELRPAGGRLMAFKPDFVNGRHVVAGDRLVSLD